MSLLLRPTVYVVPICFVKASRQIDELNIGKCFIKCFMKFMKLVTSFINFIKHFIKHFLFYHCYSELISKFNIGYKTFLQKGLSEPDFYGD